MFAAAAVSLIRGHAAPSRPLANPGSSNARRLAVRQARPSVLAPPSRAVAATERQVRAQSAQTVSVTFAVNRKVNFGQQVVLVGDMEGLGAWDLARAPHMEWTEGDVWRASVELPAGADVHFKFAVVDPHHAPLWEACDNRHFSVPSPTVVTCAWDQPAATTCEPTGSAHDSDGGLGDGTIAPAFRPAQVVASFEAEAGGQQGGRAPVAVAPAAPANGAAYSPEQLEFLRRKLDGIQSRPAAVKQATPAHANGNQAAFSQQQLEFLRRSGKLNGSAPGAPQAASPAASTSAPRAASPAPRASSPAPRRAASAQLREAASAHVNGHANRGASAGPPGSYSPEQLAFLQRAGKAPASPSPAAAAQPVAAAGSLSHYTSEQLAFLQRSGKLGGSTHINGAASRPAEPASTKYSPEQLAFLKRSGKL